MGNVTFTTLPSCFKLIRSPISLLLFSNPKIKLILCEGSPRVLKGRMKVKAGEIMFDFPDSVICHADSFYLGRPIPVLGIHEKLVAGHSYFILPLDRLPSSGGGVLSAALLSSLASPPPGPTPARRGANMANPFNCNESPLKYIKGKDGKVVMIKVDPEFITKIINNNVNNEDNGKNSDNNNDNTGLICSSLLCSTPELQKQYQQLVRAKDQVWSPKLETISEHKARRLSPARFIGLAK